MTTQFKVGDKICLKECNWPERQLSQFQPFAVVEKVWGDTHIEIIANSKSHAWHISHIKLYEEPEVSLPCVKTIPATKERRVISGGKLFNGSQININTEVGRDDIVVEFILDQAWVYMDSDELRKTAQAMNILADVLEEQEKDNV